MPHTLAGDGHPQGEVYVLGVERPLTQSTGVHVATITRKDDVEDKGVIAPLGVCFTKEEIAKAVYFTEQYCDSAIELVT